LSLSLYIFLITVSNLPAQCYSILLYEYNCHWFDYYKYNYI